MQNTKAFSDHLKTRLPEAMRFLEDLVSINSFTLNPDGVNANAQRVIEQFAPLGFTVSQPPCAYPGTAPHLVLDSGGDGPAIALISHLDTVFSPEEEARNDFRWNPEGDLVFGPGTADIKGGTVVLWMMLDALAATNPELFRRTRWIVLLNAAEEVLSADFRNVCFDTLPINTRACLVFEADSEKKENFCLVHSRKGSGHFIVNVTGRAAHAGAHYRNGASAIHQLSRVIDRMIALTDLEHGDTTVNVGVVSGGTVRNTVPANARAELETRSFDESQYRKVRDALLAMNGTGEITAVSDGHACQIEVTQILENLPWPENPATAKLVQHWKEAAASSGFQLTSRPRGGLSDGNPLWNRFPTLDGLGPRGGNVHCSRRNKEANEEQEFVDTTSFVPKALINCLAVERILAE